jgi:hypothetical protein
MSAARDIRYITTSKNKPIAAIETTPTIGGRLERSNQAANPINAAPPSTPRLSASQ